jgi:hypothetical protein
MKMAFFDENAEIVKELDVIIKNEAENIIKFEPDSRYKSVLLNHMDYSFVRFYLDEETAEFYKTNLKKINSDLSRTLIV